MLFIGFVMLASACNSVNYKHKEPDVMLETGSDDISNSEANASEIVIYKISREVCQAFLSNPSCELLNEKNDNKFPLQSGEDWYVTANITRFPIQKSLVSFLESRDKIEAYLSQNEWQREIEYVTLLDVPAMPITVWIKTTEDYLFLTVNEEPEDPLYSYRIYSQSEFEQRYAGQSGTLTVNGKAVMTSSAPKIYYDYADIPLLTVLKALGATIEPNNKAELQISFQNKVYYLKDTKLYNEKDTDANLLYCVDGGATFIYLQNEELMVDSVTANTLLSNMGRAVSINVEFESKNVSITTM